MSNYLVATFPQETRPTVSQITSELVRWRPWINCKPSDRDTLPGLAVHRFMRDRGGFNRDERRLKVFIVIKDTPESTTATYHEFNLFPR